MPEPVRGLWAADLPGFLNWLNGLSDDGPAYRLPAYAELAQLPDWTKTAHGTVWTYDEAGGYRLYQPDGISHPHSPTPAQRHAYPSLIIDRTYLLLHLATNTKLRLPRLLLYGYFAREDLPSRPEYQLIHALDLLVTIDAIRALARARAHDRALARAHDRDRDFALDRDRARALGLGLDRTRDLARDLDLARALDLDSDLALARDLDLDLDLALALALARDLDLDLDLARARDLARDLDLARALARDLDSDLGRALARGRDSDLGRALVRDLDLDLNLVRDLAVARLLQSDRRCLEVTGAGIGLLEVWTARRARSREVAPGLHAFVADAIADCAQAQPQDDPPAALGRVIGTISTQGENSWVRGLLGHARELIAPPRGGGGSAAPDDLVLAAALVLTAILAITGSAPQSGGDDPHVVLLRGVLTTLIALTIPEHENQTVLLVSV